MTTLQRNAMARIPLSADYVRELYEATIWGIAQQPLRALCESHERLRVELQGAEVMLKEAGIWKDGG